MAGPSTTSPRYPPDHPYSEAYDKGSASVSRAQQRPTPRSRDPSLPHIDSGESWGAEGDSSLPLYRSRSGSVVDRFQDQYQSPSAAPPTLPNIRAIDFQTPHQEPNATHSGQEEQKPLGTSQMKAEGADSNGSTKDRRHVDWAGDVKVAEEDEKPHQEQVENATRPGLARTMSEYENEDEAFDDYDWSDDDELVRQLDEKYEEEYKKQKAHTESGLRHRAVIRRFSPVHLAKLLFSTFIGNVLLILLLITPALVVQIMVKNPTEDAHLYFVCDNIQAWCYWVAFNFIARWVIHALFELVPRLFIFVVELIWGGSNEKFRGWVEIFTASKGYIKPLFFAGFFYGSFAITFNTIFHLRDSSDPAHGSRAPYTYRVYQVVELLFFIAVVYSVEKILIRLISLQFHAVAFADRLKKNVFALGVIDKLKDYKPKKKNRNAYGYGGGYYAAGLGSANRSGTSTPALSSGLRTPATAVTSPTHPAPAITPDAREHTQHSLWSKLPMPQNFRHAQHTSEKNVIPLQVASPRPNDQQRRDFSGSSTGSPRPDTPNAPERQPQYPGSVPETAAPQGKRSTGLFGGKGAATAQEIARAAMIDPLKTLQNPTLVKNGLRLDFASAADGKKLARDLFYAFRADSSRNYLITSDFYPAFPTRREAEAAFAVFDKDGNGDISRPEIRATILAAYKERRFLARSMQDVSEAVSTLDKVFQVVALIIIILIAFAVFGINIYSNLTTAYTIAIAVSFIFKSAAQNIFDSVIFLFATHPFDSGDRVVLEGDVFVVKRLGLFSTLFTRWDGTEALIANSKLGSLTITNYRRSPDQFENSTWQFGWDTTLEQIDALEARLNEWLQKDEKRMFSPSTSVVLQKFVYQRYIEVTIGMTHRANWQDWGERWNRRTAFHAAVLHYTKEVGITYLASAQPVMYWQDDLDSPPIFDEIEDDQDDRSPISPIDGGSEVPIPVPPAQPLLGFLPPEGSTVRRRKGRSKRSNMAGVGA